MKHSEDLVVIVIPIYKEIPSESEKASIARNLKVLAHYPAVILGPDTISYQAYQKFISPRTTITTLAADHFKDISAYNRLLCSSAFYRMFHRYRYIFICQNDAWIFSDQLSYWCARNFDFIGAPWLWRPEQVKRRLLFDLYPLMHNRVGNGGVSLRKTKTFIRWSGLATILYRLLHKNEDFIWLLVDFIPFIRMRKPAPGEALKFCMEMHPEESMALTNNILPFAIHAYERYGRDFWRPFIQSAPE